MHAIQSKALTLSSFMKAGEVSKPQKKSLKLSKVGSWGFRKESLLYIQKCKVQLNTWPPNICKCIHVTPVFSGPGGRYNESFSFLSSAPQVVKLVKNPPANARDAGSILGSGRPPGEGNSNPLQYSCLKKSEEQRSLVGYSPWGSNQSAQLREWVSTNPSIGSGLC